VANALFEKTPPGGRLGEAMPARVLWWEDLVHWLELHDLQVWGTWVEVWILSEGHRSSSELGVSRGKLGSDLWTLVAVQVPYGWSGCCGHQAQEA
jgi:hypothetical protein